MPAGVAEVAGYGIYPLNNCNESPRIYALGFRLPKEKVLKRKRGKLWLVPLAVCAGVFAVSIYHIVSGFATYKAAGDEYTSIADIAYAQSGGEKGHPTLSDNEAEAKQNAVDFAALKNINADVAGWIRIPDTAVEYPIVQCGDNNTYLHKTFSGQQNKAGAIFMDTRNQADFSDPNTLIYGHRMKDGFMFAALSQYTQQAFLDGHPAFVIYVPEKQYYCEVISAYVTAAGSEAYTLDFSQDSAAGFVDFILKNSAVKTNVTLADSDKIVTLSTCDEQSQDARMVVHARLTKIFS